MKKIAFISIFFQVFNLGVAQSSFKNVFFDSTISFRALSVVDDSVIWVGGNNGKIGRSFDGGKTWKIKTITGFENSDFRSVYAFSKTSVIIATTSTPACVLRTSDGGKQWLQVYKSDNPLTFIDGIDFWDSESGIIYGDPIDNKMQILLTFDRGFNWKPLLKGNEPILDTGEASFAASGTTIRCIGEKDVLIATGGKNSRIFLPGENLQRWHSILTPVLRGKESQGIFSIACLNLKQMIIVGGDYLNETQAQNHVFYTKDGGKTWLYPKTPTKGYRECVEYLSPKIAVAVGPTGSELSKDGGKNWESIENGSNFHVIRKARNGNLVIAAGKGRIAVFNR